VLVLINVGEHQTTRRRSAESDIFLVNTIVGFTHLSIREREYFKRNSTGDISSKNIRGEIFNVYINLGI